MRWFWFTEVSPVPVAIGKWRVTSVQSRTTDWGFGLRSNCQQFQGGPEGGGGGGVTGNRLTA